MTMRSVLLGLLCCNALACDGGSRPREQPARRVRHPPRPDRPTPATAGAPRAAALVLDPSFERSRDPFRRHRERSGSTTTPLQVERRLATHAVEELQLTAVIGGQARPRAVFRTPGGEAAIVRRGDFLGKGGARVEQILDNRVVLRLQRVVEQRTRTARLVVALRPGGRRMSAARPAR